MGCRSHLKSVLTPQVSPLSCQNRLYRPLEPPLPEPSPLGSVKLATIREAEVRRPCIRHAMRGCHCYKHETQFLQINHFVHLLARIKCQLGKQPKSFKLFLFLPSGICNHLQLFLVSYSVNDWALPWQHQGFEQSRKYTMIHSTMLSGANRCNGTIETL